MNAVWQMPPAIIIKNYYMKQNLSSKWTLPTKIFNLIMAIFPLVFLPAAYYEPAPETLALKILALSLFVAWTLFFLWINFRLKFVSVDKNNLYVSRLWRETVIPLSEIENVRLTTIGFIWVGVYFKSPTAFGQKIFFMPKLVKEFLASFQRYHPVVEELKILTHNH